MLALNLQEDWFVLRDSSGIYDTIIVSHETYCILFKGLKKEGMAVIGVLLLLYIAYVVDY